MKTIYLALPVFLSFSLKLIIKPDLFTALCVGFSSLLVCVCEYLNHKEKEKITETHEKRIEEIYSKLTHEFEVRFENLKTEVTSVKIAQGFRKR